MKDICSWCGATLVGDRSIGPVVCPNRTDPISNNIPGLEWECFKINGKTVNEKRDVKPDIPMFFKAGQKPADMTRDPLTLEPKKSMTVPVQAKSPQTGEMVRLQQVLQAIDQEPEYPGDMPEPMKQALGGNTDLIIKALRYTVSLTKKSIRKRVDALNAVAPFKIEVYQQDWTPGFAAFNDDGSIQLGAPAHLSIDLGGFLASVDAKDLEKQDLPYVIAESLMHEVIHALEAWAGQEFNEEKVEALLQKYREKYKNSPPPVPE